MIKNKVEECYDDLKSAYDAEKKLTQAYRNQLVKLIEQKNKAVASLKFIADETHMIKFQHCPHECAQYTLKELGEL